MPGRSVAYTFTGNFSNLVGGLTVAGKATKDLGDKLTGLDRNSAKMRRGLQTAGSAAGKFGIVAAGGFALAVGAAANFEQAMSNVKAATHETAGNMALLRKAAIEAGQATKFSATEAAGAIEELAKAGISTTDILDGGLSGALDLAAAGGLEVADAAQIAATALTQFRLKGEDVPHVADLLAAGAGKAQGEVSDLSMALKQSGLVASQMGISIEETSGTLAAFASAGLLGSDAGTSFRTMLLRLANPTAESAKLMESLGINAYDAQGQFVGMSDVAGQLQRAFEGKTQAERDSALATIFGSDAIRAANVLYNQGTQGIQDWTDKVNDQGYAAETASIKMDNLKGDIEQLGGAFETALIGSGGGSQGILRDLTQGATGAVNAFNDLSPAAQNSATSLLAITAVTGGGLWFTSKVVQGVANTRQALSDLGISADRTGGSLRRMSLAAGRIATLAGAVTLLGNSLADVTGAKVDASDLQRDLEALANGRNSELLNRITDDLQIMGDSLGGVTEPVHEAVTAFGLFGNTPIDNAADNINQVDQALAAMVESGNAEQAAAIFAKIQGGLMGVDYPVNSAPIGKAAEGFDAYATALDNASHAADGATPATTAAGKAASGAGDAAADAAQSTAELTAAMQKQREAALAAFDAETGWRQALKDAKKQADSNSAGIRGNSDAALANRGALSGLAAAWNNQSDAVRNNVGRQRDARRSFVETATAMGVPIEQARRLARSILDIPKKHRTDVEVNTNGAMTGINNVRNALGELRDKTIYITTIRKGTSVVEPHLQITRADGGPVPGRRHPYGDKVLAYLAPGEEVISNRHGEADRFRADRAAGRIPRYADGGTAGDDKKKPDPYRRARRAFDLDGGMSASEVRQEIETFARAVREAGGGVRRSFEHLEKRAIAVSKAYAEEVEEREKNKQHRDEIRSNAAGSFDHDIFTGGVADLKLQLAADTNDANKMTAALKKAGKKGLDGEFAAQLAGSGNLLLAEEISRMSEKGIADLERRFGGRLNAQSALGAEAVNVSGINRAIADNNRVIEKLDKRLDGLAGKLEDATYRGTKAGAAQREKDKNRDTSSRGRTR